MDCIVIGKATFKAASPAEVIYCGPSRTEARKVIESVAGKYQWIFEVSPLPIRNYKMGGAPSPVVTEDKIQDAPKTETESPKKSKSK